MRLESTYLKLREKRSLDESLHVQVAVVLCFFHVLLWALNKFGVLKYEDSL